MSDTSYARNLPIQWYTRNETVAPLDEVHKSLAQLDKVTEPTIHHKLLRLRLGKERDNPTYRVPPIPH